MTLSPDTAVVGASGAIGLNAHKIEKLSEYAEISKEFLDCTLNKYVVPVVRPVKVYGEVVTSYINTE